MRPTKLQTALTGLIFCASLLSLSAPRVSAQKSQDRRIAKLIRDLKSKHMAVRLSAADELGKMKRPAASAAPALAESLRDQNSELRYSSAVALWRIGPSAASAVPALVEALKDDDTRVRATAGRSRGARRARPPAGGLRRPPFR